MLFFGDWVWALFISSIQTRYLAIFSYKMCLSSISLVAAVSELGYNILRLSNIEQGRSRKNPDDPRLKSTSLLLRLDTSDPSLDGGEWHTILIISMIGLCLGATVY
jgi:hypothetical protein